MSSDCIETFYTLDELLRNARKNGKTENKREGFERSFREGYCRLKYNQMINDLEKIEHILENEWTEDFEDEIKKIKKSIEKIKQKSLD